MTVACAYVYVQPHHHATRLTIDYRACGRLDPHQQYWHGNGVRITYGDHGEYIILWRSARRILHINLPGTPRPQSELRVENLGFAEP